MQLSFYFDARLCLCGAWLELTCSISRHRAFIIRKKIMLLCIDAHSGVGSVGERFCPFHSVYAQIRKVNMTV